MSDLLANRLNWSDKDYTLSDLAEKMKINSCLVKSNDSICSELDMFEVLCFKHIYCVRAFKVSTPADRDVKEDEKNNNSSHETLTSGDEVFIPLHYTGRGLIVPLYGESHVCNTVEELIMTFPRYVLIEEDLKICSQSKITQLQAGCELELLRNTKDKHYQDKLICRYGAQTLQLNPSDIGRFRVRPDPNLYSVKDILQRLKLPQIIDFTETQEDQWEKEVNFFEGLAPEQNYKGKFLLTGLFKDKVAVAVSLGPECQPKSQPFLLPLSSDLLQELTFKFAFRGDFSKIKFKDKTNSATAIDKHKEAKKDTRKKESKQKRTSDTDMGPTQEIPFELTYTQYRFPQSANKNPNQGDKIKKKVQSALKSVKGKFKKASSKDMAAIRDTVLKTATPEPIRKASDKLYPILANLMNEDSSIYDYISSGTLGMKSGQPQSRFYFEIEAPKIASAPTEEHLNSETPVTQNIYENLNELRAEKNDKKEGDVLDNPRKEQIRKKMETESATRNETETETEVYDTLFDRNENEDEDATEYMNYNQVATLQIRRRSSTEKKSSAPVLEDSTVVVNEYSDWNETFPTRQQAADEKSDFSTEEDRSYAESGSSINTDMDEYDFDVKTVLPHKTAPVISERNSIASSEASVVDGSSENGSDAGSDIPTIGASNGNKEQASQLEDMSVMELCEILQQCGLGRISKLCNEHSLDGAFLCALPTDSLQEQPFSLSQLEVMKLSMMKKGWKPKIK